MRKLFVFLLLTCPILLFAQTPNYSERMLLFYENQQYGEAIKLIEETYPDEKPQKVLSQLGSLYYSQASYLLAEKYLEQALELDTTDKGVLINLARINSRKLQYPKARKYYESFLAIDSSNIAVYKALANLVDPSDTSGSKMKYLKFANKLNPIDPDVAISLSEELSSIIELDSAVKVLDVAIDADSTNLFLIGGQLKLFYSLDNHHGVLKRGQQLIDGKFLNAVYLNMIARSHIYFENYDRALEILAMIKEDKATEFTFSLQSTAFTKLNKFSEALGAIENAIRVSTSESIVSYYRNKGIVLTSLKKSELALKTYNTALQFEHLSDTDVYANVYYSIALLYDYNLSNRKEALKYYGYYLKAAKDPTIRLVQLEFVKNRMADLSKD